MGKRPKMLATVIRELIAPVLREAPPECGIVSISDVVVSDDFSHATVFVSALKEEQHALDWLKNQTPRLQRELGALYRKRIPHLRFVADEQLAAGNRIDDLLRWATQKPSKDE